MRHATAVRRLRTIAERCQRVCGLWEPGAGLVAVHAFGDVLDPPQDDAGLEVVQLVLALNEEPEQVPWAARPPGFAGLPYVLELEKAPVEWYFRPAGRPVDNHVIVRPVLIWDRGHGVQERALAALATGRPDQVEQVRAAAPGADELARRLAEELAISRGHLERIRDGYWSRAWRSAHHGSGSYPEQHLWDAVHGYLDLLAAVEAPAPEPAEPGLDAVRAVADQGDQVRASGSRASGSRASGARAVVGQTVSGRGRAAGRGGPDDAD